MESPPPPLLVPLIVGQGRICMTRSNVGACAAARSLARSPGPHKHSLTPRKISRGGFLHLEFKVAIIPKKEEREGG